MELRTSAGCMKSTDSRISLADGRQTSLHGGLRGHSTCPVSDLYSAFKAFTLHMFIQT